VSYEISFCFPEQSKIILKAFVSAVNEHGAIDKFYSDYPNYKGCDVLKVALWTCE